MSCSSQRDMTDEEMDEVVMHFSDNYDYKEMCEDYLQNEVNNIDFGYRYFAYFNDLKKETLFPILTKSLLENDKVGVSPHFYRRRPCVSTSPPQASTYAATRW